MTAEAILERYGIKETPNRILVVRALLAAERPLGLIELERELQTVERSSIFRVLTLLSGKGMLHEMEDGRGVARYEICASDKRDSHAAGDLDLHPHFFCERCGEVYCFDELRIPTFDLPDGFSLSSVNYMMKGICPSCADS